MRLFITLDVFPGLVLLFATPLQSRSDQPTQGGTLTMAVSRDIVRMSPMIRTASTEKRVRDLMYDSLLSENRKGHTKPGLAEAREVSDDGDLHVAKDARHHQPLLPGCLT